MATHPSGVTIEILGIESGTQGRHCEEHEICGSIVDLDVVVRIRKVQLIIEGKQEAAMAAYWVTDGIDRCRIGFLARHMVNHWKDYDGKLAQITDVYKDSESPEKLQKWQKNRGCCKAVIIDAEYGSNMEVGLGKKRQRKSDAN